MNFKNFGYRELHEAGKLLQAYADNPIIDMEGLRVEYDPNRDNVYLYNDEHECAMFNNDKIERWYTTSSGYQQGFLSDLEKMDKSNWTQEDIEDINNIE
jgi:hypothetical protein